MADEPVDTRGREAYEQARNSKVKKAISVLKKRSGSHENAIREFQLTSEGLKVGPPLTQFSGILTGTPTYVGDPKPLMPENADDGTH